MTRISAGIRRISRLSIDSATSRSTTIEDQSSIHVLMSWKMPKVVSLLRVCRGSAPVVRSRRAVEGGDEVTYEVS